MTAKQITGPLRFQKHNLYGESINGDPMPFGYISTSTPMPVFELNVPLNWPEQELGLLARQMAAAPKMADILRTLADPDSDESTIAQLRKDAAEIVGQFDAFQIATEIRNG